MRCGFVLPGGSATEQVDLARRADAAGWDAVFVWEAPYGVDAWSALAAMAMVTERVRLGTMLTPLAWRRPWKVASQVATLDQLSGGRAILAIGLGAVDTGLGSTGEPTDRRTRAALLDEGLDIVAGLWAGERVFRGEHFDVDLSTSITIGGFAPVQQPRPPIWIVGAFPRERSMRRVLKGDGLLPNVFGDDGMRGTEHDDVPAMRAWLDEHGARPDFDIVVEGETPGDETAAAAATVGAWRDAGATWWLETRWSGEPGESPAASVGERVDAGPPRP